MNDPVTGEPYLKKSLQLDPNCDVAALHLGIIQLRHRKNVPEAIVLFRSVLGKKLFRLFFFLIQIDNLYLIL